MRLQWLYRIDKDHSKIRIYTSIGIQNGIPANIGFVCVRRNFIVCGEK